MTQTKLSMKHTLTDGNEEQTCACQGGGCGRDKLGIWDSQMQAIYIEWIRNKVALYNTGNHIQYPDKL